MKHLLVSSLLVACSTVATPVIKQAAEAEHPFRGAIRTAQENARAMLFKCEGKLFVSESALVGFALIRLQSDGAERYASIMFNPDDLDYVFRSFGHEALYGVAAHELGHCALGPDEILADSWAGCLLAISQVEPRAYIDLLYRREAAEVVHDRVVAVQSGHDKCSGHILAQDERSMVFEL